MAEPSELVLREMALSQR